MILKGDFCVALALEILIYLSKLRFLARRAP
jgi:hypothetical protein